MTRILRPISAVLTPAIFAIALSSLASCSTQRAWAYAIEPKSTMPIVDARSVSVPPFSDQRENSNSNMWAMYLVPLAPFGWQSLEVPEGLQLHIASGLWQWRPNEDFAKATAEELQAAHIFKEAFFTNRESEGDLVLQGTIHSTKYSGKLLSYGLSSFGPLLWYVGFPSTHTGNEIRVQMSLRARQSNKVLWEKTYSEESKGLSWLYYQRSDFDYAGLYKKIMLRVSKDIRQALSTQH